MIKRSQLEGFINRRWYGRYDGSRHGMGLFTGFVLDMLWLVLSLPACLLYALVYRLDRKKKLRLADQWARPDCPIVVVGNITVGGSGKTPLVIALIEQLQTLGYKPGVVSRGYGGKQSVFPYCVQHHDDASLVGDEPVLIVEATGVPLVVDPDRRRGVDYLVDTHAVDIILADDGLQHHQLPRDIEIVVIDGQRGFGSQFLLPAGPLRESMLKLADADFLVCNGTTSTCSEPALKAFEQQGLVEQMSLKAGTLQAVGCQDASRDDVLVPAKGAVHGVAGIGNPQRFFDDLHAQGFDPVPHAFADHHQYHSADFRFTDTQSYPIIMTAKDAVKCRNLALSNAWCLPVKAHLSQSFWQTFELKLKTLKCST
jgi:tetraacyldisaccharide 4'-kinase